MYGYEKRTAPLSLYCVLMLVFFSNKRYLQINIWPMADGLTSARKLQTDNLIITMLNNAHRARHVFLTQIILCIFTAFGVLTLCQMCAVSLWRVPAGWVSLKKCTADYLHCSGVNIGHIGQFTKSKN